MVKIIWLIEEGFFIEESLNKLTQALDNTNTKYNIVKVTEGVIHCYLRENERYIIFGGNKFSELAKESGLVPGTYKNDNFSHKVCVENWGKEMLNIDYVIGDIFNIEPKWDTFFIRPLLDDKLIAGKVSTKEELKYSRDKATSYYKDKLLIASKVKKILKEYRLYIVNQEIITGSLYKMNDQLCLEKGVPKEVEEYAKKLMGMWEPSLAYVLDIAQTLEGLKVVEINNINASGFYMADIEKLIIALNDLNEKHEDYYSGNHKHESSTKENIQILMDRAIERCRTELNQVGNGTSKGNPIMEEKAKEVDVFIKQLSSMIEDDRFLLIHPFRGNIIKLIEEITVVGLEIIDPAIYHIDIVTYHFKRVSPSEI